MIAISTSEGSFEPVGARRARSNLHTTVSRCHPAQAWLAAQPRPTSPLSASVTANWSVSPRRVLEVRGNVGGIALTQIRETIAVLLDIS